MNKITNNYFAVKKHIPIAISCIIGLLLLAFPSCKYDIISDENELNQEISTRSDRLIWDYPVKPGMDSWNQLKTEQERIDVLQVPEDILEKLQPEDLVRLCLTLPAFGHFTAFNTPQDGFSVMLSRYNILKHLLSRKDIGSSLIASYKDAGMSGFKTLPYSNEFWSLKLYYIELLLSQRQILQSLTSEEKLDLLLETKSKFYEKGSNEAFTSLPSTLSTVRIMASILDLDKSPELMASSNRQVTTQLIQTGWIFNRLPPIDEIVKATDKYINNNKK